MTVTIAGTTGITQPTDTCTTSLVLTGSSSGTTTVQAAATASGTITVPAGTGTVAVNGVSSNIVSGTVTATTSGTAATYTGLPSWIKRITITFNAVSTSGTSNIIIQLGYGSTTWVTTGYTGATVAASGSQTNYSGMMIVNGPGATSFFSGGSIISLIDPATNTWGQFGNMMDAAAQSSQTSNPSGWSVALSGTLTAIRLTTVNGTDTFDAGKVNILYE
jgi:hypothetical protein